MPEQRSSFHIMSSGWDYPAWVNDFYPDDLPPEWRLAYYANEFHGVLVPWEILINAESQILESLADDVSEDFRFYLEIKQAYEIQTCHKQARDLGNNFGGCVITPQILSNLSEASASWTEKVSVYAFYEKGISAIDLSAYPFAELKLAFRIPGNDLVDPLSQRRLLEKLAGLVAPTAEVLIFLDGDPPSIATIQNLRLLAQLLGLA